MDTLGLFPKLSLFDHGDKTASILPISVLNFWLIFALFLTLLIFFWLLVREIRCWYWKINLRTELLFNIGQELEEIKEILKNKNGLDNSEKKEENEKKSSVYPDSN